MNIQELKCFAAAAETRNFHQAADQLFLTQPVVTYHIKKLEQELEVQLLERTSRSVALTPAGEVFYEQIAPVLAGLDRAVHSVREVGLRQSPRIRLGIRQYLEPTYLKTAVPLFMEEYPTVDLELVQVPEYQKTEPLLNGELDLQFALQKDVEKEDRLSYTHLYAISHYVFLSVKHPLAGMSSLSAEDLLKEKVLLPTWTPGLRDASPFSSLKKLGIDLRTEAPSFDVALLLMRTGKFVSILPSRDEKTLHDGIVKIPFQESPAGRNLGLAWRKNHLTPEMRSLIQRIKSVYPVSSQPATAQEGATEK